MDVKRVFTPQDDSLLIKALSLPDLKPESYRAFIFTLAHILKTTDEAVRERYECLLKDPTIFNNYEERVTRVVTTLNEFELKTQLTRAQRKYPHLSDGRDVVMVYASECKQFGKRSQFLPEEVLMLCNYLKFLGGDRGNAKEPVYYPLAKLTNSLRPLPSWRNKYQKALQGKINFVDPGAKLPLSITGLFNRDNNFKIENTKKPYPSGQSAIDDRLLSEELSSHDWSLVARQQVVANLTPEKGFDEEHRPLFNHRELPQMHNEASGVSGRSTSVLIPNGSPSSTHSLDKRPLFINEYFSSDAEELRESPHVNVDRSKDSTSNLDGTIIGEIRNVNLRPTEDKDSSSLSKSPIMAVNNRPNRIPSPYSTSVQGSPRNSSYFGAISNVPIELTGSRSLDLKQSKEMNMDSPAAEKEINRQPSNIKYVFSSHSPKQSENLSHPVFAQSGILLPSPSQKEKQGQYSGYEKRRFLEDYSPSPTHARNHGLRHPDESSVSEGNRRSEYSDEKEEDEEEEEFFSAPEEVLDTSFNGNDRHINSTSIEGIRGSILDRLEEDCSHNADEFDFATAQTSKLDGISRHDAGNYGTASQMPDWMEESGENDREINVGLYSNGVVQNSESAEDSYANEDSYDIVAIPKGDSYYGVAKMDRVEKLGDFSAHESSELLAARKAAQRSNAQVQEKEIHSSANSESMTNVEGSMPTSAKIADIVRGRAESDENYETAALLLSDRGIDYNIHIPKNDVGIRHGLENLEVEGGSDKSQGDYTESTSRGLELPSSMPGKLNSKEQSSGGVLWNSPHQREEWLEGNIEMDHVSEKASTFQTTDRPKGNERLNANDGLSQSSFFVMTSQEGDEEDNIYGSSSHVSGSANESKKIDRSSDYGRISKESPDENDHIISSSSDSDDVDRSLPSRFKVPYNTVDKDLSVNGDNESLSDFEVNRMARKPEILFTSDEEEETIENVALPLSRNLMREHQDEPVAESSRRPTISHTDGSEGVKEKQAGHLLDMMKASPELVGLLHEFAAYCADQENSRKQEQDRVNHQLSADTRLRPERLRIQRNQRRKIIRRTWTPRDAKIHKQALSKKKHLRK